MNKLMKIYIKFFNCLLLTGVLLINGCSSNGKSVSDEKNQAFAEYLIAEKINAIDKITSFRFHGWSSLTNDFLIISSSHKRKYLLALSGYCGDIRWAHAIIINRSNNSTLHARFDYISTLESPQMRCAIKSIYPLSKVQLEYIRAIDNPPEIIEKQDETAKNKTNKI